MRPIFAFVIAGLLFCGCGMPVPDTPLARAAATADARLVAEIAAKGTDPDELDKHGLSPLCYASRLGSLEVIDALLEAGASPDLPDRFVNGWTPLMHAVHKGQLRAARRLLEAGAQVDARAWGGTTALLNASGESRADIVRLLLAHGADPAARCESGATPLTNAIATGTEDIVRALLERDPSLRLGEGLSDRMAVVMARVKGRSDLVALVTAPARSEEARR